MKRELPFTVLFFVLVLFASVAWAVENPWEKKLPFKSATVTYEIAGTMSGSKILYVKDYGRTTAEYATLTMKMFGMTQEQKEIIITTPDWIYTADLVENTGSKQANVNKFMQEEFNKLSSSDKKEVVKNAEAQGISTIEGLDGTVDEKAVTILGYQCDKVAAMGTTAYNITGSALPLKIEGDTMGIKITQEAIGVEKGSVPASKFELPQGIRFEHDPSVDQMMQEQAKAVMENLAAGKPAMAGAARQMPAEYDQGQVPESSPSGSSDSGYPSAAEIEQMKKLFKGLNE